VCAQFVELCRKMGLLAKASVAIDGSKFKAVETRISRRPRSNGGARN
jgi:transposase